MNYCTECQREIPATEDVIEWLDGSGRICEACAQASEDAIQAGMMEGENYRDFAPPCEDDPEAYAEMVREERLERELYGDLYGRGGR